MDKEIGFINDRMVRIMAGVFVDKWIGLDELVERTLTEMVYEKVLDKPVVKDMLMSKPQGKEGGSSLHPLIVNAQHLSLPWSHPLSLLNLFDAKGGFLGLIRLT